LAEAQNRILGNTAPEVIEAVERMKSKVTKSVQFPVADTRWAIEYDRQQKIQDGPLKVATLQRRRRRTVPTIKSHQSVVDAIENVIGAKVGNLVSGLQVSIEGDSVVVQATVPSYHVRQIVERESRSIVVSHLRKKFVSSVVVRN